MDQCEVLTTNQLIDLHLEKGYPLQVCNKREITHCHKREENILSS
jgi:hypothetical protein